MQRERPDLDVDDVVGGVVRERLKITCRGRPRCVSGRAWTGGACATGRPLRGGLAASVSAGLRVQHLVADWVEQQPVGRQKI